MASLSFDLFAVIQIRPDFKFCFNRCFVGHMLSYVRTNIFLNFDILVVGHIAPIPDGAFRVNMLFIPRKSYTVNRKVAEGEMIGIAGNDVAEKIKILESYVDYLLRFAIFNPLCIV